MAALLSYALIDLASVKESLNIPSATTTYDNLIIRKINQATRAIENYCGRRFQLTTYTNVEYSATQTDQLVLRQRPVTTFTSLEVRDTTLNEADWDTVDTELYFVHANAGVLDLNFNAVGHWNQYRVNYTAGYGTIPEDLAEACASLACFYFNNAAGGNVGVMSKKEGQRELKYNNGGAGAGLGGFTDIAKQLGIDEVINAYANNPILTNR